MESVVPKHPQKGAAALEHELQIYTVRYGRLEVDVAGTKVDFVGL